MVGKMTDFTDEETQTLTEEYSAQLYAEMEENRQKALVRDSAKQKLIALGFSPNEIAVIMGEQVIDNGYGML